MLQWQRAITRQHANVHSAGFSCCSSNYQKPQSCHLILNQQWLCTHGRNILRNTSATSESNVHLLERMHQLQGAIAKLKQKSADLRQAQVSKGAEGKSANSSSSSSSKSKGRDKGSNRNSRYSSTTNEAELAAAGHGSSQAPSAAHASVVEGNHGSSSSNSTTITTCKEVARVAADDGRGPADLQPAVSVAAGAHASRSSNGSGTSSGKEVARVVVDQKGCGSVNQPAAAGAAVVESAHASSRGSNGSNSTSKETEPVAVDDGCGPVSPQPAHASNSACSSSISSSRGNRSSSADGEAAAAAVGIDHGQPAHTEATATAGAVASVQEVAISSTGCSSSSSSSSSSNSPPSGAGAAAASHDDARGPPSPPAAAAAEAAVVPAQESTIGNSGSGSSTTSRAATTSPDGARCLPDLQAAVATTPARAVEAIAVIHDSNGSNGRSSTAGKEVAAAAVHDTPQSPPPPPPAPVVTEAQPRQLMNIVFAAAEVAPFSKTGGLGDVMGALPRALASRGHRVMVVAPRYLSGDAARDAPTYEGVARTGVGKRVDLHQGGQHEVDFYHLYKDGVDWVFVDHVSYHRAGGPYGDAAGPYPDNLFRFSLLSLAALEASLVLPLAGAAGGSSLDRACPSTYGTQPCVFVANDWHTGLLPVYLRARMQRHGVLPGSACVLMLHNLAHQGCYAPGSFQQLGLDPEWYATMEWVPPLFDPAAPDAVVTTASNDFNGPTVNCLKAGLVACDGLVAVSPTYAAEITHGVEGMGLSSLLRSRQEQLRGIVNGVDCGEWDPATDVHLPVNYGPQDVQAGKRSCKTALQSELRLPRSAPRTPLIAFIGRLDHQKGPDLVLDALQQLVNMDCQVVILGSGAPDYEEGVRAAQSEWRYHVRGITKFDVPLSHRIMAAADILLMPSRFEPCGLNQLHAQRYGTLPVAHSTGGLRDTIDEHSPFLSADAEGAGTGWTFAPATLPALLAAVRRAVGVYRQQPAAWRAMQRRAMARDFSWGRAAAQHEAVMLEALEERSTPEVAHPPAAAAAVGTATADAGA